MIQLLFILLLVPLIAGGLLLLFAGVSQQRSARWIALAGSLVALALSVQLAADYRALQVKQAEEGITASDSPIAPRVEYRRTWEVIGGGSDAEAAANAIKLEFHFGLDGISVLMIALTSLLSVVCVLCSWEAITDRESEFYAALLILQSGVMGVFCAFDAVLFYVFFEFTLIPLFFLIAIWGGPQRRYAAVKFFLYTLAGSLVTLLGLITLIGFAAKNGLTSPCSLPELAAWYNTPGNEMPFWLEVWTFVALSVGFLVKVPVFPFHTWLPLAHVEAPTAGSILLAGVLLKLGTYGFLRFCLPMLPDACLTIGMPAAAILSVVGIVYGSLCALIQRDVKKLVAYSSVAHLGFCMLGLFALNVEGITGGVLQMINHGLSTGGLFLIVGMFYERYHTRMMDDLGGLASRLPLLAAGMVFISMASVGLPGLNGFPGEMLSLAGMFKRNPYYAAAGATGLVLGAWYLLSMLQWVFFGQLKEPIVHDNRHGRADGHGGHGATHDLSMREWAALAPLALACLWIGVKPQPLIDVIAPDVAAVAKLYDGRVPKEVEALAVADLTSPARQEQTR
jgi:NADH-quinone oxidoreductase subunit M